MSKKKPKARSPGKLETAIRQSLSKVSVKKLVAMNIPYLIAFYVVEKCAWLYRHCIGGTVVQKLGVMLMNLPVAFRSWIPSFHIRDLLAGIIGALLLRCVVYMKGKNAKKFRQGEEYGSARWGNEKDIEPFIDPVFENNIILTQTERLTMNSRPKLPKYARNKNVIVIGGSGSGKTRFYVKPNLMQMPDNVSYVVTDPKGTIIVECGTMLVRHGYRIKVLNTINFKKSMHYNPFHYIRSEKDILKLVNTIIANTKGEGEKATEDFWVKAERLLYTALIGYIWYEAPEEEQNFATLLEFINASETREEDAQAIPSLSQAQRIRQLSKEKQLSLEKMEEIMCEVKKGEITRVAFTNEQLHKYFPNSYTPAMMKREILALLKLWKIESWES